jgi:hypothetical protein
MAKTVMSRLKIVLIASLLFLFIPGLMPMPVNHFLPTSVGLAQNRVSVPSQKFTKVLRQEGTIWIAKNNSMTIIFDQLQVHFLCQLSLEDTYQITLSLTPKTTWKERIKLIGERLVYSDLLDGVDLCFYFSQGSLKYELIIRKPLALEELEFKLSGADIQVQGNRVRWNTPYFEAFDSVLSVYQKRNQQKVPYQICKSSSSSYFYKISYSKEMIFPIILDPEIQFSTFFNGTDEISLTSVVADPMGVIYACGSIVSPVPFSTDGLNKIVNYKNTDAFFLKIDPKGTEIRTFIIFGGSTGDEIPKKIKLSVNGSVYIAGTTTSSNFPVSQFPIQATYKGFGDLFCTIFNSKTEEVIFSTYLGGSKSENLTSIAIQPNGNAVLVGNTNSSNFPLVKPTQGILSGLFDGFLTVLAIEKKQIEFSTFLGGKNQDSIDCVTIMKDGTIVVSGSTHSPNFYTKGRTNFKHRGDSDIFVTQFSPSFSISYSNLFGGTSCDYATDITSYQDKIFLVGTTLSADFPVTNDILYAGNDPSDSFQGGDILVMGISQEEILCSIFIGGERDDSGVSISVDDGQYIYITGNTRSLTIPVTHQAKKKEFTDTITWEAGMDGYISKWDIDLSRCFFASYWGGSSEDVIADSCLFKNQLTLVGTTNSVDFLTTMGSLFMDKTLESPSFISSLQIGYFFPSSPSNLTVQLTDAEVKLSWEKSICGESPIIGYRIYQKEDDLHKPTIDLLGEDTSEYLFSKLNPDKNYYFYVTALDENHRESDPSQEVSVIRTDNNQSTFLLVEYSDNQIQAGEFGSDSVTYLNRLEVPKVNVLHYYPNKNPSSAIKSRGRDYQKYDRGWCLVNGTTPLSLNNAKEDKELLEKMGVNDSHFAISWEKLSVPNQELNRQINLSLQKSSSYPQIKLETSILLTKKITDHHWEVIDSEINFWRTTKVLFGEQVHSFTFYMSDFKAVQELTDWDGYYFTIILQDPKSREILSTEMIPLKDIPREDIP